MTFARLAIATSLVAAMGACSKANDSPAESGYRADPTSGTDTASEQHSLENTSATYGSRGSSADEPVDPATQPSPNGVGMSAPGAGNTVSEPQPTGPGTSGAGVTTGGPGVVNSPSCASGRVNLP